MIDRVVKALPFSFVALLSALLILYAFGVITPWQLFRGTLAACAGFVFLTVVALWLRPAVPKPLPKGWNNRYLVARADEAIAEGEAVVLDAETKRVRRARTEEPVQ